ncbi:transcriptional regulator [uncultured Microbulbifer sp.]|uniref:transcriptional regulator n=1 Tax=uncultured Microbulbifer sp. TaxID=348147 RepID=UPI00262380FB|nr:transcriptional regulator [uncultured Microbulbifer sp.]
MIRKQCLRPGETWEQPTGEEVREVLRLAGLTGSQAAKKLGLKNQGGRTIRRWVAEETPIPYPSWALLCSFAGLGTIWENED